MRLSDIFKRLLDTHEQQMDKARATWPALPICPDCYTPAKYHNVQNPMTECDQALRFAISADLR